MKLAKKYAPKTWDELVGQPDLVETVNRFRPQGLAGRAYVLAGASGVGKTSAADLLASEVADVWGITSFDDPSELKAEVLDKIKREYSLSPPMGKGVAYICNEIQGARTDQVRRLLGLTDTKTMPRWVTWIFTMSQVGQLQLFDKCEDAWPLLSRCERLPVRSTGLELDFALRARQIAQAENMDGQDLSRYVDLVKRCRCSMRAVLHAIESGGVLP
jgi:hypothetical protein